TIGNPIANTQLYLLDRGLHPVPPGVVGELYIGGEGLARGYLNNDLLTREKFVPDIFRARPGVRIYKTGDRGRYLHDYSIELLGRTDDQVKIRGHRIELGEIASVLLQHPAVQKAIVTVRTEANNEKRIVAYFVSDHEISPGAGELQDFISKKLPAFMLPAAIVRLDYLPLSASGKVDRKALPAPEEIRQVSGYVAPGNKVEQILVSIWQDVLDVENVGIMDNFFDLGGTSLQSLEIVAKATTSGIALTVENIFEYQTISGLSAQLNVPS
ncbi:MAG TPA: non-ribosomal peptide synthetase, partial [Flavisolibacter sp.]|nr:non-ribosomal peptide synthetase [Flavisolibacter sp.]